MKKFIFFSNIFMLCLIFFSKIWASNSSDVPNTIPKSTMTLAERTVDDAPLPVKVGDSLSDLGELAKDGWIEQSRHLLTLDGRELKVVYLQEVAQAAAIVLAEHVGDHWIIRGVLSSYFGGNGNEYSLPQLYHDPADLFELWLVQEVGYYHGMDGGTSTGFYLVRVTADGIWKIPNDKDRYVKFATVGDTIYVVGCNKDSVDFARIFDGEKLVKGKPFPQRHCPDGSPSDRFSVIAE